MTKTRRASRREFVISGLALAPTVGIARPVSLRQVDCERTSLDTVSLRWVASPERSPVDIYLSSAPDGPFDRSIGSARLGFWSGAVPVTPRPYFRLRSGGEAIETAERVLPLEGGRNFRDLGGYRGAGGKIVRWGRLYRSGEMADLTQTDYRYLAGLGIVVVCDLRSTSERTAQPTRWPGPHVPSYYARAYSIDPTPIREVLALQHPEPADMREAMTATYAGFPYDFAESYRRIFSELVAGHAPLAFNCSAGKDRSGVAAALILTALGVSKAEVLADYLLSNRVDIERRPSGSALSAPSADKFSGLPPDVRGALMRADPAYLTSAFAEIDRRDGSIWKYLQSKILVGPREIERLRRQYLIAA